LAEDEGEMEVDEEGSDGQDDEDESSEESDALEDDEDLDEADDPELRRKIEDVLRINGIEAATGETDDDSEEELMDDEQMFAIDEQLAAVFKARSEEKKGGKGMVDAQREATHYKNRVLDLVDTFMKKQPQSVFIPRFILPLVELIVSTSSDEKQLADKATGILRSRIGKAKEVSSSVDQEQLSTVLEELHSRARKAPSTDVLTTLNQCSLYVSRALIHAGHTDDVLNAYRRSLVDFATRKASRLNTNFLQDFIRRNPAKAWEIRDNLLDATRTAINGYRQSQVFQLIAALINQLSVLDDKTAGPLIFMPQLREAILDVASKACEGETATLSPAHLKEVLKLATSAVRQTKRVSTSPADVATIWNPSDWESLSTKLAASDTFKSVTGLQNLCKQVAQLAGAPGGKELGGDKAGKKTAPPKRKVGTLGENNEDGEGLKKSKHKKAKKSKT